MTQHQADDQCMRALCKLAFGPSDIDRAYKAISRDYAAIGNQALSPKNLLSRTRALRERLLRNPKTTAAVGGVLAAIIAKELLDI